jgi:hypothetical protein
VWGRVVDLRGPRIPLGAAFGLLFLGYIGIWKIYDVGSVPAGKSLSTATFCLLVACGFMTGVGSHAGFVGGINSTAKSFPDRMVCFRLISFWKIPWISRLARNDKLNCVLRFWAVSFPFFSRGPGSIPWQYIFFPLIARHRDVFAHDHRLLFHPPHSIAHF